MRLAYVNGRYLPHTEASVHIEDRGYQFADGVYEVWAVRQGKLLDTAGHLERLERSLSELRIPLPMPAASLRLVLAELVRRNRLQDGILYLQVTRGVASRDHPFPDPPVAPSLVITTKRLDWRAADKKASRGVKVITVLESRWARCDIKTIGLLPNVLAKQAAVEAGAYEAWFVDELGLVTEGSSTNAWIVDESGLLRTRDTQANILRGVTRHSVLEIARETGLELQERPFSVDEALGAREAFITSASSFVMPVTHINGRPVGSGAPGPVAKRLRDLYIGHAVDGPNV